MVLVIVAGSACGAATEQTRPGARPASPPPALEPDRVAERTTQGRTPDQPIAPSGTVPPDQPIAPSGTVPPDQPTAPSGTVPPDQPTPSTAAGSSSPAVEMRPLRPSALDADLHALGLDPKHPPPIERLDATTLRRVMKLMARSLGIKCAGCHQEGDFAAPTRRTKIASRMWDEFVVKLATVDGSPLFCDSCHQGRVLDLDRSDDKALAKWMAENFVAKMTRVDGAVHDCETCHVDMNMHFLADWAR
jgi:hypothetical protein